MNYTTKIPEPKVFQNVHIVIFLQDNKIWKIIYVYSLGCDK